jgi:hypothetical protein
MRRPNAFRRMLTAGLLLACGLQASVSWSSYIRPTAEKAWDLKALPVWQRTATLMFDEDTAGFLGFLRDTVPEEARVVVPPRSEGSIYEEIGMMQYFLIPREIHNCGKDEVEACVRRATGESTYILAVHYFPPRDLARETRRQIHYDDNRGVFAPP